MRRRREERMVRRAGRRSGGDESTRRTPGTKRKRERRRRKNRSRCRSVFTTVREQRGAWVGEGDVGVVWWVEGDGLDVACGCGGWLGVAGAWRVGVVGGRWWPGCGMWVWWELHLGQLAGCVVGRAESHHCCGTGRLPLPVPPPPPSRLPLTLNGLLLHFVKLYTSRSWEQAREIKLKKI